MSWLSNPRLHSIFDCRVPKVYWDGIMYSIGCTLQHIAIKSNPVAFISCLKQVRLQNSATWSYTTHLDENHF